jgi:hypothetical protein
MPNKKKYISHIEERLSSILYMFDPMYIARMGAPKDEYDSEAEMIAKQIKSGRVKTSEDLSKVVYKTFVKQFGRSLAGSKSEYDDMAKKIFITLVGNK